MFTVFKFALMQEVSTVTLFGLVTPSLYYLNTSSLTEVSEQTRGSLQQVQHYAVGDNS